MLEHGPIKIEDKDIENGTEKDTNYNKGQQIQNYHKITTDNEDDLLHIEEKPSVVIDIMELSKLRPTKCVATSKNSKSPKVVKTNRYLKKNNSVENNEESKIEVNCKNLATIHRQGNDFFCDKVSIVSSAKSCGHVCALYQQQKLVINCKFCDLSFGDLDNFKSHLHEHHKMFHLEVDLGKESTHRILRKRIGLRKEQQNHKLKLEHLQGIAISDSFGIVLILNHQELLMVCGRCDTKYPSLDLFEKHLRQHHIFERSRIKSEISTETYETNRETMNLSDPLKLDNETVTDNIHTKPSKRSATKRKCSIKDKNKSQREASRRTETKLETELLQTASRKTPTLMRKRRFRTLKPTIADEQSHIIELHEVQIPKRILKTDGKRLKCNECDKQFLTLPKLKEHKQRHFKEKEFKCTVCELAYFRKKELSLHMRQHSTDRRYKCSQCSKGFERNSDLKIHVRVHTGEKPFVCDICNKFFRAKQNLSVHIKSHMGEASKTYECEYCDKKFIRNIDRKIHIRSHTGEKPYKCDICQRGFSSKFNVQAHKNRDHTLPNGLRKPAKERKKPGPKPKPLTYELAKQKKLIEKLQQQLLEQIKSDEKILATEDEISLQESTTNEKNSTSHDQLKNAYELLNQITTTVIPLLNL